MSLAQLTHYIMQNIGKFECMLWVLVGLSGKTKSISD